MTVAMLDGKHYSQYTDSIKLLMKEGNLSEAESLLMKIVALTEEEDRVKGGGVAPFYYNELAKIYRKQKDLDKEVAILERFAKQNHARGSMPPKLLERLEKAKKLKDKVHGG